MNSSNSVAMKRIQKEWREMQQEASPYFYAEPLESEPFEWHFTLRGPEDTDFHNGFYHGVITLPSSYPFKPPYIIFLTPSGRFTVKEKICLTFTDYHPEYWQPAWTIRTILQALVSFMPNDEGTMAIGSIVGSKQERKILAQRSIDFECEKCGMIRNIVREKIPVLDDSNRNQDITKSSIFNFAPEKQLKIENQQKVIQEAKESKQEEIQ